MFMNIESIALGSTTGRPKAVQLLARGIIRLTVAPRYMTFSSREWVATISNPSFDASLFEIWRAILSGGTSVKQTTIDPLALRDTLRQLRSTTLPTTLVASGAILHDTVGLSPFTRKLLEQRGVTSTAN
ncbi:hypothetical protein K457DRAFT_23012 [Linnemannia elongata AG-77]|uniref:AMP-dependent synthetase/ligase domain-containing protein n=1 Tax=Linnemannia elongata AG-77 TaxID=1314771 RepID=A0A197JMF4_9FUNG|nr:hypothetical protein K457DRAFT_23012 [Linnemannia elongata AG-77]